MKTEPVIIKLNGARLSFPQLFQKKAFQDSKPAYSAAFLLDKKTNAKDIAAVKAGIDKLVKEGLKGKHPGAGKVCLRDGSEKPDMEGYGDGIMFVSARNENRPGVVDQQLNPLAEEDGRIYAGCYVNARIRLWVQDNKFGKRVNASLVNVQLLRDGEPFGASNGPAEEGFEPVEDESPV